MRARIPLDTATAALVDALGDRPPPCWSDPDGWFTDTRTAARACRDDCHALPECGDYADAVDPRYGVWAGVDRERRKPAPDRGGSP